MMSTAIPNPMVPGRGTFTLLRMCDTGDNRDAMPLYPAIKSPSELALEPAEQVLSVHRAKRVKLRWERMHPTKASMRDLWELKRSAPTVVLTDRRLAVLAPGWSKDGGIGGRMITIMDKEARSATVAGHIPLRSVDTVRIEGSRSSLAVYEMYETSSVRDFYGLLIDLGAPTANGELGRTLLAAVIGRWTQASLPDPYRECLAGVRRDVEAGDTTTVIMPFRLAVGSGSMVTRPAAGLANDVVPPDAFTGLRDEVVPAASEPGDVAPVRAGRARGRAHIAAVSRTGFVAQKTIHNCDLDVRIEPLDGGESFTGRQRMMLDEAEMPAVGDIWPCWYEADDRNVFALAPPREGSANEIETFREFGIRHPSDPGTESPANDATSTPSGSTPHATVDRISISADDLPD